MVITFERSRFSLGWFFWDQTSGYILRKKLPLKWCFIYYRLSQELFTASTSGYLLSMINSFIRHQKICTTSNIVYQYTKSKLLVYNPSKDKMAVPQTPWMFNKSWTLWTCWSPFHDVVGDSVRWKVNLNCPVSRRSRNLTFCHQLRCVVRLGIWRANGKKWQSPFLNFYFIDIYVGTPVRVREGTTILTFEGLETKN